MISEHSILSYFAQAQAHGWRLVSGSLKSGWHAKYAGRLRDYEVYVDLDEEWVYAQCPLLRKTPMRECQPALYEYLLQANHRMFMVKMALLRAHVGRQPEDWVALVSECPADGFNAGTFRLMLEAIATYAQQYDREIEIIALDARVAALLGGGG